MLHRRTAAGLALLILASGCTALQLSRIAGANALAAWEPIRPAPHHPRARVIRGARLAVTWISHATALIQLDDKLILADPVLSETAGYLSKRLVEPAVRARAMPHLDAVIISHMHLDHLSLDTLFALRDRIGELLLPQDGSNYVPDYGMPRAELATWESWDRDGLTITAVPARHDGWRFIVDRILEPRSFCGYVISYHGLAVYFAGDTGYQGDAFREIRRRFPHLDLVLMPIAPLEPHGFMARNHVNADEAVQGFLDVGADRMVPIHFDTFINSFDLPGEAGEALEKARLERGLTKEQVTQLEVGEQRVLIRRESGVSNRP